MIDILDLDPIIPECRIMHRIAVQFVLDACALTLAIGRIAGAKSESFQAIAHLFVGGLLGAFLVSLDDDRRQSFRRHGGFCLYLACMLVAIEVCCFLIGTSRP